MQNNSTTWFDKLERSGLPLTREQRAKVEQKLTEVLNYEPRIGIFGKTGAGKSSLCNALFGQDICPISDVEACTRSPQEVILNMGTRGIKLLDVPGVGESRQRDEEYAGLYAKLLPELDLVLWILKGDDRAYGDDEKFYENLVKPHVSQGKPFFFVVNQVDMIRPNGQWDEETNQPGPVQFQNMHRKVEVVADQFGVPASRVIPVSAEKKYNLVHLVDEVVYALPREKNVTVFRAVDSEFRSKAASEHVEKGFLDIVAETVGSVVDGAVEIAHTVADAVREVKDWIDDLKPWWWPF